MKSCISCKKAAENDRAAASFSCPNCSSEIIRCGSCRQSSAPYVCSCKEFKGP
ncbi:MAG TPA: zinc finger domain-containing protein [Candidatus Nanoarchaeia archaeon]|nr:zinc finger domain-containing protein [Candidatus Nanoarchaeia archaeon]